MKPAHRLPAHFAMALLNAAFDEDLPCGASPDHPAELHDRLRRISDPKFAVRTAWRSTQRAPGEVVDIARPHTTAASRRRPALVVTIACAAVQKNWIKTQPLNTYNGGGVAGPVPPAPAPRPRACWRAFCSRAWACRFPFSPGASLFRVGPLPPSHGSFSAVVVPMDASAYIWPQAAAPA